MFNPLPLDTVHLLSEQKAHMVCRTLCDSDSLRDSNMQMPPGLSEGWQGIWAGGSQRLWEQAKALKSSLTSGT